MRRSSIAVLALALVGCAKIWGFDDLSGPSASGGSGGTRGSGGSSGSFAGHAGSAGSACVPDYRLCDNLCGEIVDDCGTIAHCADCVAPQVCGAEKPNTCGDGVCVPSCQDKACGDSNGCDGFCAHGSCPDGEHCSGRACVPDDVCGVNAPCPANDCAGCSLYCSAEGRCCVQAYGCHSDGDCCQGLYCARSGNAVGTCRTATAGQRCSDEIQCSFVGGGGAGTCENAKCCALQGAYCSGSTCCAGLSCLNSKCCVASQAACSVTTDCCGATATCKTGVCCIGSGSPGCTSNNDCCAGSPGCVAGSCK